MNNLISNSIVKSEKRVIVHVIQRSVFLKMYLDLLDHTSDSTIHRFIIYGNDWHQGLESYPEYESKYTFINIQSPDSRLNIRKIWSSEVRHLLKESNMVIIHALHTEAIIFLLQYPTILHKSILRIWGEELIWKKYHKISDIFIQHMKYVVKKQIIRRIKYIISTKTEYDVIKKYYNSDAIHVDGAMTYKYNSLMPGLPMQPPVNIVVGHSGFETGNHIEILDILKKFKNEDINIYIPLSYGGTPEYISQIKSFAKLNYSPEKIHFLTEFQDTTKYELLLRKMHIGIYNAENQTGLGNISILLSNGAKLYFNDKGLNIKIIRDRGYICNAVSEIKSTRFTDFVKLDEAVQNHNINNYVIENNEEKKIREWNDVFSMNIER